MEAVRHLGITKSALYEWRRTDPQFVETEKRLPEYRKQLAIEHTTLEFLKIYRKIAKKDLEVVERSLEKDEQGNPINLTKQEQDYLLKLRSYYSPQQLQVLEALVNVDVQDSIDFTEIAKELGRSGKLRIRARREQVEVSQVSGTDESIQVEES
jgi:O6-methylguanine-DNA--protein-cysteine methyltransferase